MRRDQSDNYKYSKHAKTIRNRNDLKPWFLLTAKVPNIHMHCQSTEDQCLGNANMYESHAHSILVRISNSTIATSAQHNFIRQWPMWWVAKTSGPSNPTRCQAASAAGKKRSNLAESGPRDHAAALHGLFYLALQVICPIWWTYPCSPTAFHGFSILSMPRHHRNHDANGSLPMHITWLPKQLSLLSAKTARSEVNHNKDFTKFRLEDSLDAYETCKRKPWPSPNFMKIVACNAPNQPTLCRWRLLLMSPWSFPIQYAFNTSPNHQIFVPYSSHQGMAMAQTVNIGNLIKASCWATLGTQVQAQWHSLNLESFGCSANIPPTTSSHETVSLYHDHIVSHDVSTSHDVPSWHSTSRFMSCSIDTKLVAARLLFQTEQVRCWKDCETTAMHVALCQCERCNSRHWNSLSILTS